ncbi:MULTISPECIES: GIN domain-containing protein [unclassified Rhodanobacter]|uniref:GIN domain-containing protein n=1 Tax=unclassified Rhodanobacter TaxID=2621553 RepID=UPI0007A9B269|nr:DUF2807 domain-containing protein [Rhodanobacter sp. FW510-R10]KZC30060.1 hypothetical protein RhoFW510R10_03550 [Rhodanobacter sp. FW510-R10]
MHHDHRPTHPFTQLRLKGAIDLFVQRGEVARLTVIANDAERCSWVRTDFMGNTLTIDSSFRGGGVVIRNGRVSVSASNGSIAAGGSINIRGARSSQHFHGSVAVVATGDVVIENGRVASTGGALVDGGTVRVELILPTIPDIAVEGSGDVLIEEVQQETLELALVGSGTVIASGSVGQVDVRLAGSGDVDARGLAASRADVVLTGSGDVRVHARQWLRAHLAGSGGIVVHGSPPVRQDSVTGSGDIRYCD